MIQGRCAFAPKTCKADTVLLAQGQEPDHVGFLREGLVATTAVDANGDVTWASLRGPRSLVGFEAFVHTPTTAETRALSDVEWCSAPKATVAALLAEPASAMVFFRLALTEVLDQRKDVALHTGSVAHRVARVIQECERLLGPRRGGHRLAKAQVAALVGVRPETLSRALRELHDRRIVANGIEVLDAEALSALANG